MSTELRSKVSVPAPRSRSDQQVGRLFRALGVLVAVVAIGGGAALGLERAGWIRLPGLSGTRATPIGTLLVDQGPIETFLVESGTIESANNTTIRCEVEAILGTDGGGGRGGGGGSGGGGGGGGVSSAANALSGSSSAAGGTSGAGGSASSGSAGTSGGGGSTGGGAIAAGGSNASRQADRPVLESFSYRVTPHTPLRGNITTTRTSAAVFASSDGGGGGGRGRGDDDERGGAARILWLIDEGTKVEKGDVVAELDKSAFEDELLVQRITHAQAKSWVEQAEIALEVAKLELEAYRDGVYVRDLQDVENYIENSETKYQESQVTLQWSQDLHEQGLRTDAQLLGDRLVAEQWEIELQNALEMKRRLVEYTGPRIIKSLEAKIEAVTSDLLGQQQAFKIEDERLKRLERAIANCTLVAPADGVVVYHRDENSWGRVTDQIAEGVNVREGQAIIDLPDPSRMQVNVKINESKYKYARPGQSVTVYVDAFPGKPMSGVVKEIKPIPAPANQVSDVNLYTAKVTILDAFEGLRTGLTAEVIFHVEKVEEATRVPLKSLRWIRNEPYAAVRTETTTNAEPTIAWRRLSLGIVGTHHAEVLDGVQPGDLVIADPTDLPLPPIESDSESQAELSGSLAMTQRNEEASVRPRAPMHGFDSGRNP